MSTQSEELDLEEAVKGIEASVSQLFTRVESMDKTLFSGLKGLVMLIDNLESAVDPTTDPEEKAAALIRVRQVIAMMRETL